MKSEELRMKNEELPCGGNEGVGGAQPHSSFFIPHSSLKKCSSFFLGLGTNLGDREQNLRTAVALLEERIGDVTSLSAFYATEPWGFHSENSFLNAVCCLLTSLPPHQVLGLTQEVERDMGRMLKSKDGIYHDRLIDIDLLLCLAPDGTPVLIDEPDLKLPHPLMHLRDFVMKPLLEIMPGAAGLIRPNAE